MNRDNLPDLDLIEAARGLRDGDFTAEAYATALLDRCAEHRSLNAFIAQDRDALLAASRASDAKRRAGGALGALHGVPIAIKDNLDVAGMPTTGGTPALRGNRPKKNAFVVQQLIDAGASVLGKTNMHEMAFGITNNNAAFGPARNPYDPSRIPGGSSGGTGVAVGARVLAPAGIGSDTGGSVRVPASLCGIVGLRPSLGRWPTVGILPISHTRDTAGPMARTVADCALLNAVVTGAKKIAPRDPTSLRLGVPRKFFCDPLDDEVARMFDSFLVDLRDAGVVLVEVDLAATKDLNAKAGNAISRYEARGDVGAYLRDRSLGFGFDELVAQIASPDVKAILAGSDGFTEANYREALHIHRPALQKLYADCFAGDDLAALVFPTVPIPAAKIGEDATTTMNGQPVSTFATVIRNTGPGSVAGLPGLALPIGLTKSRLPIGVELDGPIGSDSDLLAAGLAMEKIAPPLPAPSL